MTPTASTKATTQSRGASPSLVFPAASSVNEGAGSTDNVNDHKVALKQFFTKAS
jgi:hypothetical protein